MSISLVRECSSCGVYLGSVSALVVGETELVNRDGVETLEYRTVRHFCPSCASARLGHGSERARELAEACEAARARLLTGLDEWRGHSGPRPRSTDPDSPGYVPGWAEPLS